MENDRELNIVCFIPRDWKVYQRRPHYSALARYARMLCVEPPLTLATLLLQQRLFFRYLFRERKPRREDECLYIYKPFALVPYALSYRFSFLRAVNRFLLSLTVPKIISNLNMKPFILFVFKPHQDCVVGIGGPMCQCYEASDEYAAVYQSNVNLFNPRSRRIRRAEESLLRQMDVVFATSELLARNKRCLNPNTYYVPNAADIEHFIKAFDHLEVPRDIAILKPPRIGLVGNITTYVDLALLNYLGEAHPDWSVVIIGGLNDYKILKNDEAFRRMRTMPNIHYLGWRDYEALPAYIKALDVCLMPYRDCDHIRNCHPNKMYQYLAAGKPIVSTDFPEARRLSKVIKIASDRDEFCCMVEESLGQRGAASVAQGLQVARENTVDIRARQKMTILRDYLRVHSQ